MIRIAENLVHLVTLLAWLVVWFGALFAAVRLILRGRTLAGGLVGLGAVGGLALQLVPWLFGLVMGPLVSLLGFEIAYAGRDLLLGLAYALVVALLVGGAAAQRPSAEA
ncbi:MAG: hypothetical protein R3F59_03265 [Myxococcota bacterium]